MSLIKHVGVAGALAALVLGTAGCASMTKPQAATPATPKATAPTKPVLTKQDYNRAVKFLGMRSLVDHNVGRVNWLDDTHLWWVDSADGTETYKVMDATTGAIKPAFDQAALAAALNKLVADKSKGGKQPARPRNPYMARFMMGGRGKVTANSLGIRDFEYLSDGALQVSWRGDKYTCHLMSASGSMAPMGTCTKVEETQHEPGPQTGRASVSPNGKYAVFVHDWNLWVRNLDTGKERQLTTDGVKDYGYATGNAGWTHGRGAIVRWSPDSTKVATYRQDQRKVGEMYTISTRVGHPKLEAWKYPLPGDKHVFMIEPLVIDIKTGKMVRLKMDPEQRLSTLCDTLACDSGEGNVWSDVKWAPNGKTLALVTTSRNRQHEWFRIANVATGKVHTGFHYTTHAYYESGHGRVNWQYLPKTDQAIWPTTQNNWQNLYLYDLGTGKQIRPITTGKGNVDEVLRLDRKNRTLWYVGNARTPGINPYYRQFFKVNIGTGKTTLLTPEAADHRVSFSPNEKYFVDTYSTVTQPPVTVLRSSADGHVIATLAKADITRLKAAGWVPPKVFTVKARDGKTTLYGIMYTPTNLDPNKKYPIVDYIYPGPQTGSVRSFGFSAGGGNQAMAELGFVVVAINGMGTPWRSDSFHKLWYGDMGDNTLPDQVTAIKQLAERHPWIDINRVGMWGHSGGGFATADAMFSYPDFFKVGWAESGNHDNRNYENDWGEKYQGLLVVHPDGTTNYDNQANQLKAKNLEGHLMLVHGAIDDNVPHSNTFLVVDALIKANKDFDMLILPNQHHGYGMDSMYITRRRWDYFVRYLMGAKPPHEYQASFGRR